MCNYMYMSSTVPVDVIPVARARAELSAILRRFRVDPAAPPVIVGSHRRPEAALVPIGRLQRPTGHPGVTLERLRAVAPLIARLARTVHLGDVRVFGSVARGEQTATSDVDLLVTPGPGATLFDIAQFEMDMELLLETSVSAVPATSLDPARDADVLRDAVPL